jgi:hypothetical protein
MLKERGFHGKLYTLTTDEEVLGEKRCIFCEHPTNRIKVFEDSHGRIHLYLNTSYENKDYSRAHREMNLRILLDDLRIVERCDDEIIGIEFQTSDCTVLEILELAKLRNLAEATVAVLRDAS